MKRVGLLAFVVLFILTACIVQAKDSGVRFSDLSGEVLVRPDEDRLAWEFAEMEMILNVMDHIQTKKDASAILSLTDMTTFVMKPESEIILNTESEKENKIELLAGKVWVNVKKMVKDGTMNVEMSQAVAGIKGTNITCSSNQDGSENRIQVLRGIASIMIRESKEQIELTEGEELVVKKGVKPE
ncbi:MAG: FecR family protein, partial [Candidatus Riflebacteria bacterium]